MAGDTDAPINYEEYASEICNDNENVNVPIPCDINGKTDFINDNNNNYKTDMQNNTEMLIFNIFEKSLTDSRDKPTHLIYENNVNEIYNGERDGDILVFCEYEQELQNDNVLFDTVNVYAHSINESDTLKIGSTQMTDMNISISCM
ncbi:hypothetical protein RF55_15130 [Lasius niger]|uniref:Uncharacterized protein n=1 Tax=Lasius niger TaxID=67767 RepID=A0A0J7K6M5_LASNI|nr:hypothetical protein RF55_15130 [Lasius niger]